MGSKITKNTDQATPLPPSSLTCGTFRLEWDLSSPGVPRGLANSLLNRVSGFNDSLYSQAEPDGTPRRVTLSLPGSSI